MSHLQENDLEKKFLEVEVTDEPIEKYSEDIEKKIKRCDTLLKRGNIDMKFLKKCADEYPEIVSFQNNLSYAYHVWEKYDEQEKQILYTLRRFPTNIVAFANLVSFYVIHQREGELPALFEEIGMEAKLFVEQYPNVKLFHVNEIIAHTKAIMLYYAVTKRVRLANTYALVLKDFVSKAELKDFEVLVTRLYMAKMLKNVTQEQTFSSLEDTAASLTTLQDDAIEIISFVEEETQEKSNPYIPSQTMPIQKSQKMGRNDRITVQYEDGRVEKDIKFKKVEDDLKAGKCVMLS